jgi:MOSC domain-containing protein YiiM
MELRLLSVNVAKPKPLATIHGEVVLSGIAKEPVTGERVFVGHTNIEGDGQADLSVHGGPDKAVYAYPADNWAWWESEHKLKCAPGTFGENLTLAGADESVVRIGDRFRWGDALLEVSEPRAPCFKFAIHAREPHAPAWLTQAGRCGWYLRVIEEGAAPTRDAVLMRVETEETAPTVRESFLARFDPAVSREARLRVLAMPRLAPSWRESLEKRLSAAP